jgi:ABC-type branched-subunit amino acid transport system permease subunit
MQRKRRNPLEVARPARAYWIIALVLLVVDQFTKWLVRSHYQPGQTTVLIPGVFEFVRVGNEGAAFGMLPGRQIVFIFTSIAFLVGIVVGGLASVSGALYGALFIQFVPNIADQISKAAPWAIYGLFVIGFMYAMPGGIAGLVRRISERFARGRSRV